jgi:hypothetical protein
MQVIIFKYYTTYLIKTTTRRIITFHTFKETNTIYGYYSGDFTTQITLLILKC